MHVVAKTDIGLVRKRNEDFYVISTAHDLVVVCDGMGGHPGGDLASSMAAEEVQRVVEAGEDGAAAFDVAELQPFAPLIHGVFAADRKLRAYGRRHTQYAGMGTTLVALQERDGMLCIVHVGDSRVYCLKADRLVQLTADHSVVAEMPELARRSFAALRNILTRALGVGEEDLAVDFTMVPPQPDETYVLCTDGLHNYVDDERILEVLASKRSREDCLQTLIDDAKNGGGADNITLALAWVTEGSAHPARRLSGAVLGRESGLQVQLRPGT